MAKIVIIEDDDIVRGVLVRAVKQEWKDVLDFEDGQPALEKVNFETVDLVLTDLNMPTPGSEVLKYIRDRGICTPAILLTGQTLSESERKSFVALGNCRIMAKPFALPELIAGIKEMLNR